MYSIAVRNNCLCLLVMSCLCGCGSTVRAPVDSSATTPPVERQPSYSSASDSTDVTTGQRDYHLVARGDTLYSIAWRYGFDYRDVARWNGIFGKYVIYPGQLIRLKPDPDSTAPLQAAPNRAEPLQPGPIVSHKKPASAAGSPSTVTPSMPPASAASDARKRPASVSDRYLTWRWPTNGKLVKLNTPTSMKGLDISGRVGQTISAAAGGDVVYSGSGLKGYGKLIIIKHNDTFLSAYAHNEKLIAREGDTVAAGQQIATMGVGNRGQAVLHFEIRKDGTPVNPLQYLPKNRS